jgi:predicted outer membrane protein
MLVVHMKRAACLMFAFAALMFGPAITKAQTADAPTAPSASTSQLSAVDANFVAQANLGAPFQIDSGRLAEKKGTTAEIRDYAHLMVVSHIPVVNALNAVLQRKNMTAKVLDRPEMPRTPLYGVRVGFCSSVTVVSDVPAAKRGAPAWMASTM